MAEVFSWVRGIVFYLIFVSLLYQLLPGEKYKKYVHVCAGMIFVLVVMSPLLRLFHVNDRLAYYTSLENFKIAVRDAEFNGTQTDLTKTTSSENTDATAYVTTADNQKLDAVWTQYKSSIEKAVFAQFEGAKVYPIAVDMTIDEDESSDSYGCVQQLSVTVTDNVTQLSQAVSPVDSVDIHVEIGNTANTSDTTNTAQRPVNLKFEAELDRIKENIAQKLNMSTENIDIIIA